MSLVVRCDRCRRDVGPSDSHFRLEVSIIKPLDFCSWRCLMAWGNELYGGEYAPDKEAS